ncbi:MAG: glycosyltransferase family 2 protein [Deltaproteobacteria bacterium]|nr:glycosyltransferase family 2 protein [Deltaproteobacteria bacterium]
MPEMSIIIVSWNAREYLVGCLMSLYEEDLPWAEIIVVDNGSSDGSPDTIEELFPEVRLIRSDENLGFAKANNIGIMASSGKYVCLINSDVVVLGGCLEALKDRMDSDPSAGLVCPKVLNPDMTLQPTCRRFPSIKGAFLSAIGLDSRNYMRHDSVMEAEAVSGCFMLARRAAIDEAGLLDERFFFYAEDKDWCRRIRNSGWKIVYLPEAKAVHYGGSSSSAAPVKFYIELHKANLKYWRKYHGSLSAAIYLAIVMLHQALRIGSAAVVFALVPGRRTNEARKVKRSAACLRWLLSGKEAA